MEKFINKHFTGERALYKCQDAVIDGCLFDDGESPLKEGRNLTVTHTTFGWKYPLWYGNGHHVSDCTFLVMSRSGLWYTNNSDFTSCHIIAPKEFRRCSNIKLADIVFDDAQETLWSCQKVNLDKIQAKGDYFGMNSSEVQVKGLSLDGNYPFDGGKDITVEDSVLNSKDAFWNCQNVTIKNTKINGEYFGWNSQNLTLINCQITSHQGFCYIDRLVMKNCTITDSDLIFELCSNLDIEVTNELDSVKNPISGRIKALGIKELILDKGLINPQNTKIEFIGK